MALKAAIADAISIATGLSFKPSDEIRLSGGCISQAFSLSDGQRRYFVKANNSSFSDMFEAEAAGLLELESAQAIRVPHPVTWGRIDDQIFLALEQIDLSEDGDTVQFGQQLAQLHRKTAQKFGWARDNYIGNTPQTNQWASSWVEFLRNNRFGFQIKLAKQNRLSNRMIDLCERLLTQLNPFFVGYAPVPSLLHGDLWGGNAAFSLAGMPVIFDPAVYYGDREADLAMTELFGGFGSRFYAAYRESWPLDPGYRTRKNLYNLYHILNHANIFYGSYPDRACSMAERLLAELK